MSQSVQEILENLRQQLSQQSETSTLDAQVLLAHCLGRTRSWTLAHPETTLSGEQIDAVRNAALRITQGEPLPYVIGHWEFFSMDFKLDQSVLIPRPETELLVERGISWLQHHPAKRLAVDVGTGSGCIGLALAKHVPDLHIILTDISPGALHIAQSNAREHSLLERVELIQADLLTGLTGPFDLICANLPYIPTGILNTLPVARREPRLALDGGLSGIDLTGRLLPQVQNQLAPGGLLLMEIEASQGSVVKTLAEERFPLSRVQILKDLSRFDRCLEIEKSSHILHICPHAEWLNAQVKSSYQDFSLQNAGFIHCSQPEQILEVANRFYRGSHDLILLWIDPAKLTSKVRWEPADGAMFPHVYGPINLEAVVGTSELIAEKDGAYRVFIPPGQSKPGRDDPA